MLSWITTTTLELPSEVGKASWVHAIHTVVRMSSPLNCNFGDTVWSSSYRVSEFTALTLHSFWPAGWPCASHMRFLQHIKNEPAFSFYREVVHQDDYAWLMCNPEQEHLGTFPYGGGLWKYTSCFLLQPQMACRAREGKINKSITYLRSDIKTNFFHSNT